MRIILWDIDGTLVDIGGAGAGALAQVAGLSPGAMRALAKMNLGGMTDRRIARILCAAHRHHERPEIPLQEWEALVEEAEIDRVLGEYLARLGPALSASPGFRILPGVERALDALEGRAIHALGTGNVEEGARLKLERGGLWTRFHFGGYGSDAEERADLLRAACRKASERLARPLGVESFVVVGDTPRDIEAAHAVGLACVAVATGTFSSDLLRERGADVVFDSLESPGVLEAILEVRR